MLGTINGIRGHKIEKSKELLETGIKSLIACQDFAGAWLGWNNLGEIFSKQGEFRQAFYFLNKALEMAEKLACSSMKLESLRNLLDVHWRRTSALSKETITLLATIEMLLLEKCEHFVGMQIHHT